MREFSYFRAGSMDEARQALSRTGAVLLAGGTTLLDLAKCGVTQPDLVIDITHLSGLSEIVASDAGVTIGALATMAAVADDDHILSAFPAVAQSLSQAASPQLRNMATIGGNLLQRTRCAYFREPGAFAACNKRAPGSGCSAIGGINRSHAVLGTSESCIASYPGDLATALLAFDATVHLGERAVPIGEFFLLPGSTPEKETVICAGEMITAITVPASAAARNSTYLKVRDRQSYEFAAASAAVGIEFDADGRTVRDIRVALGGVATIPWRARVVEEALIGKVLDVRQVEAASKLAVEGAVSHGGNEYKIKLVPSVVARAILTVGGIL
ncbi:xanthine dehydrogenase family protein subunit M [Rhizobium sp. Root1220]|uniref:FAD binding domain-containing protein n=1 Tax=Rhizobium sp. Root1220 TaxID=1736432 RepID=UPI0006F2F491|nr:xanthine dehydrogenase family protein subunit M [Rhizobium sp. Root1220]KQV79606.1 FAD-binding molybdopterin dehydrogenase [Rhizobium sp. Root1220]